MVSKIIFVLLLPCFASLFSDGVSPAVKRIEQRKNQALKQKPLMAAQLFNKGNGSLELVRRPVGLQLVPMDGRQLVSGLRYNQPSLSDRIMHDMRKLVWAKRTELAKEINDARAIANETALRKITEVIAECYGDDNPTVLHFGSDLYLERGLVVHYLDFLSSPDVYLQLNPQERELLRAELQGYYNVLDELDCEVNIVIMGTDVRTAINKPTPITVKTA